MTKHLADIQREASGLPPIYCDPPRPLTDEERRTHFPKFGRGNDGDIIVRDSGGSVVRRLVPMVSNGYIFYQEV